MTKPTPGRKSAKKKPAAKVTGRRKRLSAAEKLAQPAAPLSIQTVPSNVGSSGVAAPSQPQPEFVDRGMPIPQRYGHDRIEAEVRDPNAVFVYWALDGSRCEDIKRQFGGDVFDAASWIFRIHSDGPGFPCDVPIDPEARNWYLHVPENRDYTVEIGILPRRGGFVSVLCANAVRTPRVTPSDDQSCEWMLVEGDFERVERVRGNGVPRFNGAFARGVADRFLTPTGSSLMSSRVPGSYMMGSAALQRHSIVPPPGTPAAR